MQYMIYCISYMLYDLYRISYTIDWNFFMEFWRFGHANACMFESVYVESCIRKMGETVEMTNETLIRITGSFPNIQ